MVMMEFNSITSHFFLWRLHVEGQRCGESGAQVAAQAGLDVVVQLFLVDLQDEVVRVEGRVELVHQDRQAADLITQRFRHLHRIQLKKKKKIRSNQIEVENGEKPKTVINRLTRRTNLSVWTVNVFAIEVNN